MTPHPAPDLDLTELKRLAELSKGSPDARIAYAASPDAILALIALAQTTAAERRVVEAAKAWDDAGDAIEATGKGVNHNRFKTAERELEAAVKDLAALSQTERPKVTADDARAGRIIECPRCQLEIGVPRVAELEGIVGRLRAELSYRKAAQLQQRPPFTPRIVQLHKMVLGDGPFSHTRASPGIYAANCNQWGAVSVIAENGEMLGCRWTDFDALEWEPNPFIAKSDAARAAKEKPNA